MANGVQLEVRGSVAEVILDGPSHNSLDRSGIEALLAILEHCATETSVRAVIISGANGAFCGGRIRDEALVTEDEIATDLAPILALNQLIETYRLPLVAAVDGVAFGFGFGLATLCDVAVVGSDARFALTELAHGIPPLIVLSYLFSYLPYKVAFDLALTGREIGAEEARHLGLATEVCPAGSSLARARERVDRLAEVDPEAIGLLRSFSRRNASLLDGSAASEGAQRIAALLASRSEGTAPTR